MNVVTFTNVVISKGYEDNPAIRIINKDGGSSAFFRIGEKVYDKRAKDNYRWNNWDVKVFGSLVERIRRMKLDGGSYVNLAGRVDIDTWDDNGVKRTSPSIILSEIEFCHSSNQKKDAATERSSSSTEQRSSQTPPPTEMPENFTGYEPYDGETNPFFP